MTCINMPVKKHQLWRLRAGNAGEHDTQDLLSRSSLVIVQPLSVSRNCKLFDKNVQELDQTQKKVTIFTMVCASLDKKHDPFCALRCHICYTLHSQVEGQYLQISFADIVIISIWRYPSSINLCISQVYLHYFCFLLTHRRQENYRQPHLGNPDNGVHEKGLVSQEILPDPFHLFLHPPPPAHPLQVSTQLLKQVRSIKLEYAKRN
jgi:hypothetical protein